MASKYATQIELLFDAAREDFGKTDELRQRVKRWGAAKSVRPVKKLIGMVQRDDGTFALNSSSSDGNMGPQGWLRSSTSLPGIAAYHPVLQGEHGMQTTEDLSAFAKDVRRLALAETGETADDSVQHLRLNFERDNESNTDSGFRSLKLTSRGGIGSPKFNIFYPSNEAESSTETEPKQDSKKPAVKGPSFLSGKAPASPVKAGPVPASPAKAATPVPASPVKAATPVVKSAPVKSSPTKAAFSIPSAKSPSKPPTFASPPPSTPPRDNAGPDSKKKGGLKAFFSSFNTLARRKIKKKEVFHSYAYVL
jgi:hypothetical protein